VLPALASLMAALPALAAPPPCDPGGLAVSAGTAARLKALFAAPDLASPAGWSIGDIATAGDRVAIGFVGPGGARGSVRLVPPDEPGRPGRHFSIAAGPGVPEGAVAMAAAAESRLDESPWTCPGRDAAAARQRATVGPDDGSRHGTTPAWVFWIRALTELAVVLAALGLALRHDLPRP
jgi:hypothetical protein